MMNFLIIQSLTTACILLMAGSIHAEEKKMVLPPLAQVGTVVKDMDKAITFYEDTFGMGPFDVIEFVPLKHWCEGKPCPIKLKIGFAELAPGVVIELVQPIEGDAPHQWFLDEYGEGMQHLGYEVDNYDEWMAHLKSKGIDPIPLQNAELKDGDGMRRAAYMKTDVIGGVIIELIEKSSAN